MKYECRKEIEKLEKMIAVTKKQCEEISSYLVECNNKVMCYDSKRDEDERLNEVRYYAREAEDAQRDLELASNTVRYLEQQLEILKK